ncbi:MAG: M14 family metallocarboxypeptidase [Oscillospiraceae bacterium]|nr:M14 family metallocarboxypeptidase [Oscillospiraceae bacterium]
MQRVCAHLQDKCPALRVGTFGRSLCGRALWALSMGQGESVLVAAAFHGQEWISTYVALRLAEDLCAEGTLPCRVVIVPSVNPDGVEIALHGAATAGRYANLVLEAAHRAHPENPTLADWNANARGVDLNHDYDAGWQTLRALETAAGITAPAPRRYGGTAPASEPETQALIRLTRRLDPVRVVALHSQGEEIYWQYGGVDVSGAENLARAFAQASGYKLVENDGLASHGGYKDWFIQEYTRPGFTLELGKGQNPLPLADFAQVYERAREMLLLATKC